ncbi:uncharacterized protein F5891DRAFT_1230842 [Suillus fuscotomentosus]|uniref:Sjogrens syndrome scleroderma autoantigen 1 family protein n=1 Tax=Suillus fuscotomentosus TaxID=1912939 RepID=A0AAD4HSM5_9AGAM|nr:uncharacterized protein F5891DRAFT_1230842 [Suillus fuscotomentosus]KAG1907287.1 hypothetical protein F5891DRAFT_1230842 [Suillus fuscotomentosus]
MSTSIVDVSSKLGEYMIKGWVLTDTTCPSPACCGVPLMRSPNNGSPVTHLCVNCNGPQQSTSTQSNSSSTNSSSTHESNSRPSTPPTELSSALSSPTFAPPIDTEEIIRRRQQSDQASAEIGKRLLKGWAMLGEECPNIRCYGVPLVRPPKGGEERDPRKECVVCGTVYVTDVSEGWQRLVPAPPAIGTGSSSGAGNSMSSAPMTLGSRDKGKAVMRNIPSQHASVPSTNAYYPAQALKLSLDAISQRLAQICETANQMDVASIASAADAINKVAQALSQVRQLGEHD